MTIELSTVPTDPAGVVVDLITGIEPNLDRATVVEIIESTAAGRAKRRRLAQALQERPGLLTDGRSPAPRVVGDLLIALRAAGASYVSPPVCTQCGKQLRTLQRRGEDWYCGVCGPRTEPCAACGNTRPVACRDRQGRPRCLRCPPDDGRDPVALIVEVVAAVDPAIPAETVATAARAVAVRDGHRRRLAWALQERPELLTGAGAEASIPSVLRLIDALCLAGTTRIVQPPCPHCGRTIALVKPRNGVRLCRNCVAKSRAQPCARCGTVREAATRDEHGRPLCPHCLITDPANQETCIDCGRRRPVSVRTPHGPLCPSCRPAWQTLTCSICGQNAPCVISKTTGKPWCRACKQRWAPCAGCGQVKPIRGGTRTAPLCATCTKPDPAFWRTCPNCGQPGRIHNGRRGCAHCTLQQRLRELLSDDNGQIHPQLQTLHDNLASYERPSTVQRWLDKDKGAAILRELATGQRPLSHTALDELPAGKPVEHLRAILVATAALPVRDEQMARLERWITHLITTRADPTQQHLLRRYGLWHLLRRLRGRLRDAHTTHEQIVVVQQHLKAAVALLDWLTAHDQTLATAGQRDLDTWLASDQATHRREVGHFVRWANTQKLTRLELPATRWGGPSDIIDTEARWQQARRLLHDDTIDPDDRVAGLLVLLYAQWPATISRLTLTHIDSSDDQVRLRLGQQPIVLPEPLATLVRGLVASRRGHAALGDQRTSRGCSPADNPADPSAPTNSPNGSANSACAPADPDPQPCSNSPPTCPPRCWPACSASTSASPSPGNAPAPATGPTTPPRSAEGNPDKTRHSESSDI
ncbi:MAG TPA: hypothetical protein VFB74_14750 [Kribbellaceae bacterium]|nr:hypothetical protein [Kribbellaceae bacterium]